MNCAVWRETFCTANSWIMPKLLLQYYTCINYLQIKTHVYTGIEHLNKMCDQIFLLRSLMKFSNNFNWCFIKIHTFVFWEMNNDPKKVHMWKIKQSCLILKEKKWPRKFQEMHDLIKLCLLVNDLQVKKLLFNSILKGCWFEA